ncbi:hypothetical protein [Deinococcus aerophilus]|uniref:Recombinase domain-containing protein n=1 Tax=Deinococcus aerophilus TaxID=522488 RepID=A0ABQ2H006_9DEIO|nr:hypothetical protein [Deinococcus aerophilus]GGM21952.1 hypothetical protein GCM10010841_32280 [Deinococcus aerophilus]
MRPAQQAATYAGPLRKHDASYAEIASELNANGFRTRRGSLWEAKGILRMLAR